MTIGLANWCLEGEGQAIPSYNPGVDSDDDLEPLGISVSEWLAPVATYPIVSCVQSQYIPTFLTMKSTAVSFI